MLATRRGRGTGRDMHYRTTVREKLGPDVLPGRQLMQLLGIFAYIAKERDGLGRDRRRLRDEFHELVNLGAKFAQLVKVDGAGGGQHFVDCIVHRADK